MSTYQGKWPEDSPIGANVQVTVDGQPLSPIDRDVPGAGQAFGWGGFSRWANSKLLSFSILQHEFQKVMGLPEAVAHKHVIDLGDAFLDEQILKLGREWSMTSEDIHKWIEQKHPTEWAAINRIHA